MAQENEMYSEVGEAEYEWKHVIILNNMVTVSLIGKVIFGERLDRVREETRQISGASMLPGRGTACVKDLGL